MRLLLVVSTVTLLVVWGCDVGGQKQSKKGKQAMKKLEEQWKKAVKEADEACAKADKNKVEDVLEAFEKCKAALDVLPFAHTVYLTNIYHAGLGAERSRASLFGIMRDAKSAYKVRSCTAGDDAQHDIGGHMSIHKQSIDYFIECAVTAYGDQMAKVVVQSFSGKLCSVAWY